MKKLSDLTDLVHRALTSADCPGVEDLNRVSRIEFFKMRGMDSVAIRIM